MADDAFELRMISQREERRERALERELWVESAHSLREAVDYDKCTL